MSDYIKREDVVEKLVRTFLLQAPTARAIIEAIPAADVVERKKGCWYTHSTIFRTTLRCTNCQKPSEYQFNFCPNCGARMVENEP